MALAAGWTDQGNNLVKNTANGQMVPQDHPIYQQALSAPPAPGAPAAPSPMGVGPSGAPPAPPGPITTAQQVSSGTSNVGQQTPAGQPTTVAQSFQQALVNRMNPAQAGVNDPGIRPALDANRLSEQRSFESNRNMLAERSAAQGTSNSGGFETGLLGLAQDRAAREGQFAGNAVMQGQQRNDANQTSAMGMTGQMLGQQQGLGQQMTLAQMRDTLSREGMGQQMTLAQMDDAIRRQSLAQQSSLGQGDLALRSRLGEGQLNLGLLSTLQNNDQFGRQLNQSGAQFGAGLDQQAILAMMGHL